MATIEVTKRVCLNGHFEYIKEPETFKTYAEAVRHYNGVQAWYDKQWHRFTANGCLYYMKVTNRKTGTATIREYENHKCINKYHTNILSSLEFEAITKLSDESIEIFIDNNLVK